ncbi:hypothetical protein LWI29_030687 [Acer saccharum]|uniref:Uncharacterized protein n=1 Tax=Acer saccharum TaxID=4024 RepID=A0AA39W106_ACESA|nr:hypothetical protein LWI29_030687 [Acer saccharum]
MLQAASHQLTLSTDITTTGPVPPSSPSTTVQSGSPVSPQPAASPIVESIIPATAADSIVSLTAATAVVNQQIDEWPSYLQGYFLVCVQMFPFQNNPQNVNNMLDGSEEDLDYEPYSDYIVKKDEDDESEDNLSLGQMMTTIIWIHHTSILQKMKLVLIECMAII